MRLIFTRDELRGFVVDNFIQPILTEIGTIMQDIIDIRAKLAAQADLLKVNTDQTAAAVNNAANLRKQLDDLSALLATANTQITDANAALVAKDTTIADLSSQLNAAQAAALAPADVAALADIAAVVDQNSLVVEANSQSLSNSTATTAN